MSQVEKEIRDTLSIAKMYLFEGKYDEAFKMSKDIFEMTNKYIASDPRLILKAKNELDSLLDALLPIAKMHLYEGKYDEAFKMSKDIFEMTHKYFESDPRSILKSELDSLLVALLPIAKMHLYEGKYDEAFKMSKYIFEMTNKYFESDPRSILKSELDSLLVALLPIAKMHLYEGKYDEAFKMSKDVYEISYKYFGSDHHTTLQAKQDMKSANVNQDMYH